MSKFMNTVKPDFLLEYSYAEISLATEKAYASIEGIESVQECFTITDVVTEGVIDSIKSFFQKIWEYICRFCNWVKEKAIAAYNWIKNLFKKKKQESEKTTANNANSNSSKDKNDTKLIANNETKYLNPGKQKENKVNNSPNEPKMLNAAKQKEQLTPTPKKEEKVEKQIVFTEWVDPDVINNTAKKCLDVFKKVINNDRGIKSYEEPYMAISKDKSLKDTAKQGGEMAYAEVREDVEKAMELFDKGKTQKTLTESEYNQIDNIFKSLNENLKKMAESAKQAKKTVESLLVDLVIDDEDDDTHKNEVNTKQKQNKIVKAYSDALTKPIMCFNKKASLYITYITNTVAKALGGNPNKDIKNDEPPVQPAYNTASSSN